MTADDKLVGTLQQWQKFHAQADAGVLRVNPEVAVPLQVRCDRILAVYGQMLGDADQLKYIGGMGTLPSAVALKGKFEAKAAGGPDNLKAIIQKHIEIVKLQKETFRLAMRTLTEQDQARAAEYRKLHPEVQA